MRDYLDNERDDFHASSQMEPGYPLDATPEGMFFDEIKPYQEPETPTEKAVDVLQELRAQLEFESSGPTDDELVEYLLGWLEEMDGAGLVVTEPLALEQALRDSDFIILRKMFLK